MPNLFHTRLPSSFLALAMLASTCCAAPPDAREQTLQRNHNLSDRCRLIIVPAEHSWLIAAAVPVVEKLRQNGERPFLLATTSQPIAGATRLMNRFRTAECVVLAHDVRFHPYAANGSTPFTIRLSTNPVDATMALAKRAGRSTTSVTFFRR